jgi:hypothetical protein
LPDLNIGPTEEIEGYKTLPKGVEKTVTAFVNMRKAVDWKMELLAEYNDGERHYATICSCYECNKIMAEKFLVDNKMIDYSIKNKKNIWRRIGYKTNPGRKENKDVHPWDEFSTNPDIIKNIKAFLLATKKGQK